MCTFRSIQNANKTYVNWENLKFGCDRFNSYQSRIFWHWKFVKSSHRQGDSLSSEKNDSFLLFRPNIYIIVRAVLEIQFNEPNELKSAHHTKVWANFFPILLKAVLSLLLFAAQKLIHFLFSLFLFFCISVFANDLFAVTLPTIESLDFGHGCSFYRNCPNWVIPCSLCCASSRWSFCIGTITSPFWSIHGSHTRNTHHRPDGSSWWIIVYIRSCIRITRCVQWATNRHVSFQWWSHRCNWPRWLSAVQSTFGPTITCNRYKVITIQRSATSHRSTSSYRLPCILATLYYSHVSSTSLICRRMHAKESVPPKWNRQNVLEPDRRSPLVVKLRINKSLNNTKFISKMN